MKWMLAILGSLFLAAGVVGRFGEPYSPPPAHSLTCRALGEHGPGSNPRVRLTEYTYLKSYVRGDVRKYGGTSLTQWFPVAPIGDEGRLDGGANVHVVLEKKERVFSTGPGPEIEGTVKAAGSAIAGTVSETLRADYPKIDIGALWVFVEAERGLAEEDEGHRTMDAKFSRVAIVVGLALTVLGVVWIVLARRARP